MCFNTFIQYWKIWISSSEVSGVGEANKGFKPTSKSEAGFYYGHSVIFTFQRDVLRCPRYASGRLTLRWSVVCGMFTVESSWDQCYGEAEREKASHSTGQRMRTTLNSMGCSPARMIFRLCCNGGDSQVLCSHLHQLLDINYSRKKCGIGYSAVCSWNNPPRGPSLKSDLCPPVRLTRKVKN